MYWLNWLIRTTLIAFLAALNLSLIAMLLSPWAVAQYWRRGQRAYAFGAVAGATFGFAMGGDLETVLYGTAVAALGILGGHALLSNWNFGRCVSVLTGSAFGLVLLNNALHWEVVRAEMATFSRSYTLRLEQMQSGQGESLQAQIDSNRWLLEHFDYVAFGGLFSTVLVLCTAAVSLLAWNARKEGLSLQGRFSTMRPPDWLVWVAIATALAALAEYRWPNDLAQLISWNTAVGLCAIYWLNGIACVIYLVTTLQLNLFLAFALAALLVVPTVLPMFSLLGFFDTWLELRHKVDKLAEMRRNAAEDQGNG